jgi:hypothetical protein
MTKPTIPEVLADFKAYFQTPGNGAWGSLHIVLDDGNFRDGDVQFCIDRAIEKGDTEGERLARILLKMSATQRRKMYGEPWR